jgi:hypothetical protein
MSTTTAPVFQTAFGKFAACDKETWKKLKKIRRLAQFAEHRSDRWMAWNRKIPKNRRTKKTGQAWPEPVLFARFYRLEPRKRHSWETWMHEGQHTHLVVCTAEHDRFFADYWTARHVTDTPEELRPLSMTVEEIDALLADIEAWYRG